MGSPSFNGATTVKSWKGEFFGLSHGVLLGLQWSHDGEVVEGNSKMSHIAEVRWRFNGATTVKSWKGAGSVIG